MGIITIGHILDLLPEVRHGGIGIVAAHGPDRVGVRTSQQYVLDILQRQDAVVLEQYHCLGGNVVSRLSLFRGVEGDILLRVEIRILVEESHAELDT